MRYLIALFLACFIALPAHAKVLDIQEVTSKSGIKAWLVEDHAVPVIAVTFSFKGAGSSQDSAGKQGTALLASNTMDEGAGDLDSQAFQKELRDLSLSLSFGTSRDNFGGRLKTLTVNKTRAFELMKLALMQPRFDSEAVERMRASNLSRIRENMTDPDWIGDRLQNAKAFENHPYGQNSGGTLTTIAAITPDDLKTFAKTRLGKNNLVVSVAGDMTADEVSAMLDEVFAGLPDVTLPALPALTLQNEGKVFLYQKDIPQTIINIMQPGIGQQDPDYHYLQLTNYILGGGGFGSRLMEEVREKRGLTYGIYTGLYLSDYFNGYTVSTSTENKNVPEVLTLINQEWEKIATTPPSETELKNAKAYLLGALPLTLTSTGDIPGLLNSLQEEGLPIDYLDLRAEKIKNATAADIQNIAKRVLDDKKFMTVLVGSPAEISGATIVKDIPDVK